WAPRRRGRPMTNHPASVEERWRQIMRQLGELGYSREQIDAIPTEEEAWRIIEKRTPSRKANGANGYATVETPVQPDQDEPIEPPAAIHDAIAMWRRQIVHRKGPAEDILNYAARDLFGLLKVNATAHPHLQNASHQVVVDTLQELGEFAGIDDAD